VRGPDAKRARLLAVHVLAPLVLAAASAAARAAPPEEFTQLSDGPGRDLTVGRCIVCHSLEYIPSNAPAMNRAAWQKTIQKMKDRFGAPITDAEAKQILDYLDASYSGKAS
jgi:sulfite dehydrogenase (cytochrome) subunit B